MAKEIFDIAGVKGGLVVHFGCAGGELTVALRAGDAYRVHGLAFDAASTATARRYIQSLGLYGNVSVELFSGNRLPYVDNLVNLFVAEDLHGLAMEEVLRVLAPGGTACIRRDGRWSCTVKPRSETIDDWTHALYDASNNAVSRDTVVGPPQHLQWLDTPRIGRHHNTLASVSAAVSAAGRLFYISDEAPGASIAFPPQWELVARDAFNGLLLWRRPIASWESYLRSFRSGPVQLSRRLVAMGDRVYVTLGFDAPVTALDAATGQTLATYAGTEGTDEILCRDGTLYLVVAPPVDGNAARPLRQLPKVASPKPTVKTVIAVEAATGHVRWKRSQVQPLPMSLTAGRDRVFWQDPTAVVCVDAQQGSELWHTPRQVASRRPGWSSPTLVVQGDVLLCADRLTDPEEINRRLGKRLSAVEPEGLPGDLVAYSARTGEALWTAPCGESFCGPVDVFVNDNLVWLGQSCARLGPDYTAGFDLLTGRVQRRISPERAFATTMTHHRCYRDRATVRYLLSGRTGVEFIDVQSGDAVANHWVRGVCQYGVIPANGLLYAPPHACACYVEAKLNGLLALAPKSGEGRGARGEGTPPAPLERGPAYEALAPNPSPLAPSEDWPTYRHDAARSGRASTSVASELKCAWQAPLGGRLSSPVIADGQVVVASIDAHTVHALDAASGKPLWQYTAGGRIDSPPTLTEGLAVFGSADGWVYCLRAHDGQLVWRYRVAPEERRLVAFGQLESVWPASGSVLVHQGHVYCAAGRSSYVDGGICLEQLDLKTGKKLAEQRIDSRDPNTGRQPAEPVRYEMPGALPDVLSCDGQLVYMRHLGFDPQDLTPRQAPAHLYSPAGFLDGEWWHRTYWIFGEHFYSGYVGWYFAGRETPAGRLLVMDDAAIYGFGFKPEFYHGTRGSQYDLFAIDRRTLPPQPPVDYARANRDYPHRGPGKFFVPRRWAKDLPLLARAMVLAGDALFMVGPPAVALESRSAFDGGKGALLCAVSTADGQTLAEYQLDALPVFDGLAAAQQRLYVSLQDGRVLCLSDRHSTPGGTELSQPRAAAKAPAGTAVEPGPVGH